MIFTRLLVSLIAILIIFTNESFGRVFRPTTRLITDAQCAEMMAEFAAATPSSGGSFAMDSGLSTRTQMSFCKKVYSTMLRINKKYLNADFKTQFKAAADKTAKDAVKNSYGIYLGWLSSQQIKAGLNIVTTTAAAVA